MLENFTERDLIATVIMFGYLTGDWDNACKHGWERIAHDSYMGADFMLRERECYDPIKTNVACETPNTIIGNTPER